MRNSVYILILAFALSGCFKEDEPVPPYVSPEGVTTVVAEIGPDYGTQLFYDLETNTFFPPVDRSSWDLAFSCEATNPEVRINGAKLMRVYDLGPVDFETAQLPAGSLEWKIDAPSGNSDSLAFGTWGNPQDNKVLSNNHVYVVDLGLSVTGQPLGRKKVQFVSFENQVFTLRFGDLQDPNGYEFQVAQDADYSFRYLSLQGQGELVQVAPPKEDWDLMFSQYTSLVLNTETGIKEQYSVNGTLLNPYLVQADVLFDLNFENIDYTTLGQVSWTGQWDIIGYDWKDYDFDIAGYYIATDRTYFVQSVEGNYFAFRFTGFVNQLGQRGYPTLELRRL